MSIPEDDVRPLSIKSYRVGASEVLFNALPFCKMHALVTRKQMCAKMKVAYPSGVGVVLHLASEPLQRLGKHLKDADRPYIRVVVQDDIRMGELVMHARRMFSKELPSVAGLFLYLCDGDVERIVSLQAPFREYLERSMKDDGLCHFVVTVEAVFGCPHDW
jgi:hypothetical protein